MIRHVVMFTWAEGTTDAQKQAVHDGLSPLPDVIPQIRSYRIGDDAGLARRNFHRGLVAFHGHQALVGLDTVTRPDQQLDHRNLVEVPDIGNFDVYQCHVLVSNSSVSSVFSARSDQA
jgi:hypothetical protein